MFSQVSVCPRGVYASGPRGQVWQTSPWQTPPRVDGQQAGGTHPTGMRSCLTLYLQDPWGKVSLNHSLQGMCRMSVSSKSVDLHWKKPFSGLICMVYLLTLTSSWLQRNEVTCSQVNVVAVVMSTTMQNVTRTHFHRMRTASLPIDVNRQSDMTENFTFSKLRWRAIDNEDAH